MKLKYLMKGVESTRTVNLMLSITKIESEEVIAAIHAYLVNGMSMAGAALINDVPKQNLSRAMVALEKVAEVMHKLKHPEEDA
jgi:hypothetical protein